MKRRCITALLTSALLLASGAAAMPLHADPGTREVTVTSTEELTAALADARAGDTIVLREGVYENDIWPGKWAAFYAEASGTQTQPITIRSEDPAHPATVCGVDTSNKIALYIIGDWWRIEDLKLCCAQKGLVLDQSSHSRISGCEVFDIGSEGIHLRDDSAYCVIEDCYIHDTGTVSPQYGEGIYIGSAVGTEGYGFACHYNTVRRCTISHVAAECVDIKEFTLGTLVEDCIFDGDAIAGENGANSFIEIKGNDAVIRRNTGYRNGNAQQLYGFDLYCPLPEWGQNARIYENTLYLDSADIPIVAGWNCSAKVFRNVSDPPGCGIYKNGNRIMDVLRCTLRGDATEDGAVDAQDVTALHRYLHRETAGHLSQENADVCADGRLNVLDLTMLKRAAQHPETAGVPVYTVSFRQEEAGKWRMSDGLGDCTLTFTLQAQLGTVLNLGWGYWDPNTENDDGTTGKWHTIALGKVQPDADGIASVTVSLPTDCTRTALEVWDYLSGSEALDKADVTLTQVTAAPEDAS